jgi:hypothetical protein
MDDISGQGLSVKTKELYGRGSKAGGSQQLVRVLAEFK